MKVAGLVRTISGVVTATAIMSMVAPVAQAQQTTGSPLFPSAEPFLAKSRMTMRLGYTSVFTKTKSGAAYDVTGPVATRDELAQAFQDGEDIATWYSYDAGTDPDACDAGDNRYCLFTPENYGTAGAGVLNYLDSNGIAGIGTPPGIKAKAGNGGTPTLSIGYWLDDEYKWFAEALVLGAPIKVKATGDGINPSGRPNGINGKEIISTKLLPPLVILSRNFGAKDAWVRPYVGVGATYAIFFDTKTTEAFNTYQGGRTSVSLKNAFGVGPFVGLQSPVTDGWHVNLSVGHIKLKTQATLVTYDTRIRSGDAVLRDLDSGLSTAITDNGEALWDGYRPGGAQMMTTAIMELVAKRRNCGVTDTTDVGRDQVNACTNLSLGNFVRKQNQEFANTIVTVSVGRSF